MHFQPDLLPNELLGDLFLAAYGQHGSAIQPYVWHVLPASSPYPDAVDHYPIHGPMRLAFKWKENVD